MLNNLPVEVLLLCYNNSDIASVLKLSKCNKRLLNIFNKYVINVRRTDTLGPIKDIGLSNSNYYHCIHIWYNYIELEFYCSIPTTDDPIIVKVIIDLKESMFVPNKNYKIYLHSLICMCLSSIIKEIPDVFKRVWIGTYSVDEQRCYITATHKVTQDTVYILQSTFFVM